MFSFAKELARRMLTSRPSASRLVTRHSNVDPDGLHLDRRERRQTDWARGDRRSLRLATVVVSSALTLASMGLHGCVAAVVAIAVGVDSARTSDVAFDAFENSWVAPAESRAGMRLRSVAVVPFTGDPALAAPFSAALREATTVRALDPTAVASAAAPESLAGLQAPGSESDTSRRCQALARTLAVDGVLIGRLEDEAIEAALGPWKTRQPKRLHVALVSSDGRTVWRDELPLTVTKGAKDLDATYVGQALTQHLTAHAREIGLTSFLVAPRHRF